MEKFRGIMHFIPEPARIVLVFVVGWTLIIAGLVGLLLPLIPGWLLIFVGMAVLATEFKYARKVNDSVISRVKTHYYRIKQKVTKN